MALLQLDALMEIPGRELQSLTRFAEEYGEAMSIRVLISETMRPSAQEGLNPEGLRDPIAGGVIFTVRCCSSPQLCSHGSS